MDIPFKTCISASHCLRDMARRIEKAHGSNGDWRIVFEDGLRGFAARLSTVMGSVRVLDEPFQVPIEKLSPEQWAVDTDRRIGEIFFAMDSALECFVFAMNAVGFLKSPADFCDITTPAGLKLVRPDNIVSHDPKDKRNPRPGYASLFPRIVAHWAAHGSLIGGITEWHDVSKHRSCTIASSAPGIHSLPDQPKAPGSLYRTPTRTVEETVEAFHKFAETLIIETAEELSGLFGIQVDRTDHP